MLKKLLLLPLLVLSLHAAEDRGAFIMNVLAPKECGEVKLNRYADKFSLSINDDEQDIPNYMVSKPLRKMTPEQLAGFLQSNYLTLKQCSDGEFSLEEHGRLHGGGLFSAGGGYLAGKWGGQAVVIVSGYAILLTATAAVTVVGGREAGGEFFKKVQNDSIPHLWEASEKISQVTGAAGGVAGLFVPAP